MAVYRCRFCGSVYDEEKEGTKVSELKVCPVCRVASDKMVPADGGAKKTASDEGTSGGPVPAEHVQPAPGPAAHSPAAHVQPEHGPAEHNHRMEPAASNMDGTPPVQAGAASAVRVPGEALPYDPEYARVGTDSRYMDEIHEMAVKGQSIIAAMGTQMPMPGWDDILFLGAQLNPMPLDEHAPVKTETIIGKHARKPMVLEHPVYISHMSFGALSKETKTALAKGSAAVHTAMCSGEGGILPEERDAAYRYIFEYVPNLYSVTEENLKKADAIEIKSDRGQSLAWGAICPGIR